MPLLIFPPGLVEGNVLPFAPEWQAHVGVAYEAHAGDFVITAASRRVLSGHDPFRCHEHAEIAQLDDVTDRECVDEVRQGRGSRGVSRSASTTRPTRCIRSPATRL